MSGTILVYVIFGFSVNLSFLFLFRLPTCLVMQIAQAFIIKFMTSNYVGNNNNNNNNNISQSESEAKGGEKEETEKRKRYIEENRSAFFGRLALSYSLG